MQSYEKLREIRKNISTFHFICSFVCYYQHSMSLELHPIGDIGESQRCELIHYLVGAEIEGLPLERLHLQILQYEVVRGVTLVDGVLHGEGIAHVHALLFTEGIKTIDIWD